MVPLLSVLVLGATAPRIEIVQKVLLLQPWAGICSVQMEFLETLAAKRSHLYQSFVKLDFSKAYNKAKLGGFHGDSKKNVPGSSAMAVPS